MASHHENEFMGGGKAKLQTYLIRGGLLVVAVIVGNLAFNSPEAAKNGVSKVMGLPGWAIPILLFVPQLLKKSRGLAIVIYYLGCLKNVMMKPSGS